MKKIISILFILCGIFSSMAYAQGGLTYSGTVIGEDGLELIGVKQTTWWIRSTMPKYTKP